MSSCKENVSVCLSTNDMYSLGGMVKFDTDSNAYIVDNSANTNIWTVEKDSILGTLVKITKSDTSGVATI